MKTVYNLKNGSKFVINNKTKKRVTFTNYERARQYARKLARQMFTGDDRTHLTTWDSVSRNPTSLRDLGFHIVRVSA